MLRSSRSPVSAATASAVPSAPAPATALGAPTIVLRGTPIPARAHRCPGDPTMAQIVVLDGTAIPTPEHWHRWMRTLADHGFVAVRTGALAPRQAGPAERAGLRLVQELSLLDAAAPFEITPTAHRTHRLRAGDLATAADIDRSAFGDTWALDATMLADIRQATPAHRARVVRVDGHPVGFLISGRAARVGYVQRLAVHPSAHRQGIATSLLIDGLRWMRRARVRRAFVNTHVENAAALELYRRHGFVELPERLRVYEGAILA